MNDRPNMFFGVRNLTGRRALTQLYQRSGCVQQFDRLPRERTSRKITSRGVRGKVQGFRRYRSQRGTSPAGSCAPMEHAESGCLIERTNMNWRKHCPKPRNLLAGSPWSFAVPVMMHCTPVYKSAYLRIRAPSGVSDFAVDARRSGNSSMNKMISDGFVTHQFLQLFESLSISSARHR
jgi:hypothetical protein